MQPPTASRHAQVSALAVSIVAAVLAAIAVFTGLPAPAHARGVSLREADRWAKRTYVQLASRRITFTAVIRRVITAADGSTITAAAAVRRQSADGTGQIVLLFRGHGFLGWTSAYETLRLQLTAAGTRIVVHYGVFRGNDPFCCPSSTKRVVYRWNGTRVIASGQPLLIYGRRGERLHLAGS